MKFSAVVSLLVSLPLLPPVFSLEIPGGILPRQNANKQNGGNGNNGNGNGNGGGGGGDPQTSLTLDPQVIAPGFANDGQDVPAAGQVASLTSTNNFINFCLTVPLPLTDGKQVTGGSCNPAPIGAIPSVDGMPSSKFTVPKNGDTIPSDEAFTITMAIANMQTGAFVNAQANYFSAPQQLNAQGKIVGHSHVVVELLSGLDQTNSAANHQPVVVPIAQHGSLDDCVYFTATPGGAPPDNGNNGAANGNNGGNNGAGANNGGNNGAAGNNGGANNGGTGNNGGANNGGAGNNGGVGNNGGANNGGNGGAGNNGSGAGNNNGGGAGGFGGFGNKRGGFRGIRNGKKRI
ncbi:hypothetical protein BD779DRAFT_485496 [Infundibulicybe gibba]|nr:hypothetical protein BD779DRAFT_485496 [Infundibulicybe gibba]